MDSVFIALILNAMNGGAYSLNMDRLMPSLPKTTFTIFLTDLDIKGQEKTKTNLVKAEMQQMLYFSLLYFIFI